ncbi:MAG: cobalt ECF transporter T component CbiQ [Actinobacteria bacterium]|nr:cobalt ECF transporter T component CbiQ [Actinomycetota bacterium]
MGAGHAHPLYVHGHSPIHHLAPEVKIAAAVAYIAAAAVTPRQAIWAFGVQAAGVAAAIAVARLGPRFVLRRLTVVVPFVAFALCIPFIASGERIDVVGLSLSREGLWGAWNVVSKATIGASVSILLAGTTEVPRLLTGLSRLRVPGTLTAIAAFMVRYLEVIAGELGRMRTAMAARGYAPRWLWQARPVATSAGALFVRSYERGERVHAAMLSRGYTGTMPDLGGRRATAREWILAAAASGVAWLVALAAITGTGA